MEDNKIHHRTRKRISKTWTSYRRPVIGETSISPIGDEGTNCELLHHSAYMITNDNGKKSTAVRPHRSLGMRTPLEEMQRLLSLAA